MINIEKIDAVIAATGAEYAVVRQALLATDGDVAAAIRMILNRQRDRAEEGQEEKEAEFRSEDADGSDRNTGGQTAEERRQFNYQAQIDDIIAVIKEIWRSGNASSLIVEKNGKTVLNLSLTVSAFILIITPLISLIGLGTAILSEYTIKIQMVNGEVIDVIEYSLKHGPGRHRIENEDQ